MNMERVQRSFASGVLSRELQVRVDSNKYYESADIIHNMQIKRYGGLRDRGGYNRIQNKQNSKVRLIPFIVSREESFVLAIGNGFIDVYKDGKFHSEVFSSDSNLFFNEGQLQNIRYVQSYHVMTLVHFDKEVLEVRKNIDGFYLQKFPFFYASVSGGKVSADAWGRVTVATGSSGYLLWYHASLYWKNYEPRQAIKMSGTDNTYTTTSADLIQLRKGNSVRRNYNSTRTFKFEIVPKTEGGVPLVNNIGKVSFEYGDDIRVDARNSIVLAWEKLKLKIDKKDTIIELYDIYGDGGTGVMGLLATNISSPTYADLISGGNIEDVGSKSFPSLYANSNALNELVNKHPGYGYPDDTTSEYQARLAYHWTGNEPESEKSVPKKSDTITERTRARSICYFQQRTIFGGTDESPDTIYTSVSGKRTSFVKITDGNQRNPIEFSGLKMLEIRHLLDLGKLVAFGMQGEFLIGTNDNNILTENPNIVLQSEIGCSEVTPMIVHDSCVFVEDWGSRVFDLNYIRGNDKFVPVDLTTQAYHLFEGYDIVSSCYAKMPDETCLFARNDGKVISMTYIKNEQILAFSVLEFDGKVTELCAIREIRKVAGLDQKHDSIYIQVEKEVSGEVEYNLGRLSVPFSKDQREVFCLDNAVTYDGRGIEVNGTDVKTNVVDGLEHLKGQEVAVIADGSEISNPLYPDSDSRNKKIVPQPLYFEDFNSPTLGYGLKIESIEVKDLITNEVKDDLFVEHPTTKKKELKFTEAILNSGRYSLKIYTNIEYSLGNTDVNLIRGAKFVFQLPYINSSDDKMIYIAEFGTENVGGDSNSYIYIKDIYDYYLKYRGTYRSTHNIVNSHISISLNATIIEGAEILIYSFIKDFTDKNKTGLIIDYGIKLPEEEEDATIIHVGLPYMSMLKTLSIDTMEGQTLMDKKINIGKVTAYINDTRYLWTGKDNRKLTSLKGFREIETRDGTDLYNVPKPRQGPKKVVIPHSWEDGGQVVIKNPSVLPMNISAVVPEGRIPVKRGAV